jgi:hypothetical protein
VRRDFAYLDSRGPIFHLLHNRLVDVARGAARRARAPAEAKHPLIDAEGWA